MFERKAFFLFGTYVFVAVGVGDFFFRKTG